MQRWDGHSLRRTTESMVSLQMYVRMLESILKGVTDMPRAGPGEARPPERQRPPVRGIKDARLNLRVSRELKEEIERAARVEQKTLSGFIVEKVHLAAREVLAEQTEFALPDPEWTAFCAALEGEARPNPALRKLMARRTPLDGR